MQVQDLLVVLDRRGRGPVGKHQTRDTGNKFNLEDSTQ
jgi:hypothetical protein